MSYFTEYVITFALAFIISFSATPIVRRLAFKVGGVDIPKDDRRMHRKPIALMGGLAIICGFTVSLVFDLATASNIITPGRDILGLVSGMAIIIIMGILDDIKTLNAWVKLLFQKQHPVCTVAISGTRNIVSHQPVRSRSVYRAHPVYIDTSDHHMDSGHN